jgi:hypothetical protein
VVVNEAPLPLGVQAYDAIVFPVHAVALAETVRLGLVQVIGPLLVALTVGRQVSTTALHDVVEVHPLD